MKRIVWQLPDPRYDIDVQEIVRIKKEYQCSQQNAFIKWKKLKFDRLNVKKWENY